MIELVSPFSSWWIFEENLNSNIVFILSIWKFSHDLQVLAWYSNWLKIKLFGGNSEPSNERLLPNSTCLEIVVRLLSLTISDFG